MSLNTGSPDAKKPCKGILKTSSSFDKHTTTAAAASTSVHRKSAKFDELNVLQTYHPPDKDYGHMKVDEPKTPYNYVEQDDVDHLDAELLAEKLRVAAKARSGSASEESSDEDEFLSEEEKKHKLEFERRRKAHYNEFEAVKLARKLIEEEDDDDEDGASASKSLETKVDNNGRSDEEQPKEMETEEVEEQDRKNGGDASCSPLVATTAVTFAAVDCEAGSPIPARTAAVNGTRKSVISFIVIISVLLTILSMACVAFLFQPF